MDSGRVFVDVSELPPPEPLAVVMEAAEGLGNGQFVHMHHRREPLLLYERLARGRFGFDTRVNEDDFEVFIWRLDDEVAETAARRAAGEYPPLRGGDR